MTDGQNKRSLPVSMEGVNVKLRAPEPADIDFIYLMENNPAIWHIGNTFLPYSRFQIEQYVLSTEHDIFSERQFRLIIETKPEGLSGKSIGAIDLFDFDPFHKRAGLGILIIEGERRKGFAGEALDLITDYCFNILNLHQVYCSVSANNTASIRLFQKAGFKRCGLKKEWRLDGENWIDEIIFQLIKN
jgi:diamine N-acetyltransferase